MTHRLSRRPLFAALAVPVLAGCNAGSDSTSSAEAGNAAAPAIATPIAGAKPTVIGPTDLRHRSNTGPAVTPPAGFGNAQGRVLWNEKPAAGIEVQLCENVYLIGGCRGEMHSTKTDSQGNYTIDKVPPNDYSLAVRVFSTDTFIFPTNGTLLAAKYSIKSGETLDIRATNLLKTDMQVLTPHAGETFDTGLPKLSWKPYPGAATYEVNLDGVTNSVPQTFKTAATEVAPETSLLNGAHMLKVTAFNANGVPFATATNRVLFTVTGQNG